ncbi:MAG: LysM peptidoglycan-binding domain-containing protein [Proteobacteria bacterium]|nr:LysM peptidoglycan-binding domain-containing protein [Pseudomonadota bacterium]
MKKMSLDFLTGNCVAGLKGLVAGSACTLGVTLVLLAGPSAAVADTVAVPDAGAAPDKEPLVYTVVKGDTLWDITGKYLEDPYKWPRVWKSNPYIKNPHLIFPGDVVRVTSDGIEIISRKVKVPRAPVDVDGLPVVALEDGAEKVVMLEPEPVPPPRVKGPTVGSNLMKRQGFVSDDELSSSGAIIESKLNMIMMDEGAEVFVSLKDAEAVVGDRYSIYVTGSRVAHPETGVDIGYMVDILGSLVLTDASGVVEARIDNSFKEVEAGALLMPYIEPVTEVELTESTAPVDGVIVAALDASTNFAGGDIVYIDRGLSDGLGEGNVLRVFRDRPSATDPVTKESIELPPINLGTMVVLDPSESTSTCIVLKGLRAMVVGDKVSTMQAE